MNLEPYLFFDGTCEEALRFYAGVFHGEIAELMRWADAPDAAGLPPDARARVMHASFVSPSVRFMASDSDRASGAPMARVALSLGSRDAAESERVFNALAEGGAVSMPYGKTFWGAMFGTLTDRFGIDWMVNCELSARG